VKRTECIVWKMFLKAMFHLTLSDTKKWIIPVYAFVFQINYWVYTWNTYIVQTLGCLLINNIHPISRCIHACVQLPLRDCDAMTSMQLRKPICHEESSVNKHLPLYTARKSCYRARCIIVWNWISIILNTQLMIILFVLWNMYSRR
jgi:hypothetical protein